MNVMMGSSLLLNSAGYQISRSVRLRSSATGYFNRTPASAGNRKTWTWSAWVKRGALSGTFYIFGARQLSVSTPYSLLYFASNDTLTYIDDAGSTVQTTQVFRDPSAWYHIVLSVDTTQATAANRYRMYVNGSQITSFGSAVYAAQNSDTAVNAAIEHDLGIATNGSGSRVSPFDGYLTEINFIDGQALTPSSFGETNPVTGVWQPKKYAGTYGTNGFYLNFSDNSAATAAAIGKDYSGNGNNWTPNNISVTAGATYDSMLDVPTPWPDGGNGRGNYAVLNPLKNTASISNANLQTVNAASAGYYTTYATASMDSGKYYWEIVATDDGVNARYSGFGIADPSIALTSIGTGIVNTQAVNSRGWLQAIRSSISAYTTGLYNNGAAVNTTTRATTSGTRIFMVAYDADSGKCWMGYEGTWWTGDPAAGTSQYFTATAPMMPVFNPYNDGSNASLIGSVNFGQRPFAYTPPSGFLALNALNLPTPTILKGNQYFNANTYSGTVGVAGSVTGVGFQPDFVWVKSRNAATGHVLVDSARGVQNGLFTQSTSAEITSNEYLLSFNADGFSYGISNAYSQTSMVSWNWKEGATQGFDIAAFTAPASGNFTVAHSLGVAPAMFILKSRSVADGWYVYHKNLATPVSNYLTLNATSAVLSSTSIWGNTAPTSSVVTLGANAGIAGNATGILYLFAQIAGYSAFGSYTGNGSADGPFVFCGFRPRFIMFKKTSAADDWVIYDTARDEYNVASKNLYPNGSFAEDSNTTNRAADILSNGFKLRSSGTFLNGSGATFIFAAFAENPFKYALAR